MIMARHMMSSFCSLNDEDQIRIGRDGPNCSASVGSGGRAQHFDFLPDVHVDSHFVPALDHLSSADPDGEGLSTLIARIEFRSVLQGTIVVHVYFVAHLRLCALIPFIFNLD